MLVDGAGVPWALVVTGAKRHDVSQLERMLDSLGLSGRTSSSIRNISVLMQGTPGNRPWKSWYYGDITAYKGQRGGEERARSDGGI